MCTQLRAASFVETKTVLRLREASDIAPRLG